MIGDCETTVPTNHLQSVLHGLGLLPVALENDDKMQTCILWSTSRAVPMSCTALEMRCNAENDIQMQVGASPDDGSGSQWCGVCRWRVVSQRYARPSASCACTRWCAFFSPQSGLYLSGAISLDENVY